MAQETQTNINPQWIETEVWKPIPNTNGLYEASSFGNVRRVGGAVSCKDGRTMQVAPHILKPCIRPGDKNRKPRRVYSLCFGGKHYTVMAATCVASAFLEMPFQVRGTHDYERPSVNHIDENPMNDRVDNLEWVTKGENIAKYQRNHAKGVVVLSKETGALHLFTTGHEASAFMGKNECYISEKIRRGQFENDQFAWFVGFVPGSQRKEDIWMHLD